MERFSLAHGSLRLPHTLRDAAMEEEEEGWSVGTCVEVTGIVSRPELNGRLATVQGTEASSGRLLLRVHLRSNYLEMRDPRWRIDELFGKLFEDQLNFREK